MVTLLTRPFGCISISNNTFPFKNGFLRNALLYKEYNLDLFASSVCRSFISERTLVRLISASAPSPIELAKTSSSANRTVCVLCVLNSSLNTVFLVFAEAIFWLCSFAFAASSFRLTVLASTTFSLIKAPLLGLTIKACRKEKRSSFIAAKPEVFAFSLATSLFVFTGSFTGSSTLSSGLSSSSITGGGVSFIFSCFCSNTRVNCTGTCSFISLGNSTRSIIGTNTPKNKYKLSNTINTRENNLSCLFSSNNSEFSSRKSL